MGVSHTYHPPSRTHGLADGCPRCAQHAEHPLTSLDDENLRVLVERLDGDLTARSANEAIAMVAIENAQEESDLFVRTMARVRA